MNKNLYLEKCLIFEKILLDLACGEVVSCTSDFLELRVFDEDNTSHCVVLDKSNIKYLTIILNDYIKSL